MTHEPARWLLPFAGASAAAFVLLRLAGETAERALMPRGAGPEWLAHAARDVTALGGVTLLAAGVAVAAGLLWLRGQPRVAGLLAAAVGSGLLASQALKAAVGRPRPPGAHLVTTFDASFPSGHAMLAAVVYLTLAALLARAEAHRPTRGFLVGVGLALVVAVGASRVWLGVHWPTDVLAGWSLGALWAWGAAGLARRAQRAGAVEPPL